MTGGRGPSDILLGRRWLAWRGTPQARPHHGVTELKWGPTSTKGVTSLLGTDTREVIFLPLLLGHGRVKRGVTEPTALTHRVFFLLGQTWGHWGHSPLRGAGKDAAGSRPRCSHLR